MDGSEGGHAVTSGSGNKFLRRIRSRKRPWLTPAVYFLILVHFLASNYFTQHAPHEEEAPVVAADPSLVDVAHPDGNETKSNVTLTFKLARGDRMGSRIQLPLMAWIFARHRGWDFCSPMDDVTAALGFPICFEEYDPRGLLEGEEFDFHSAEFDFRADDSVARPGVYYINMNRVDVLLAAISDREQPDSKSRSMLNDETVKEWRRMVLGAAVRPEMEEMLWLSEDSVRIAVHARRGDILPGKRNDAWIGDDQLIALIELSKHHIRKKRGNETKIEVHMFSESYGAVNWTRYGGLVDEFHLAPRGPEDLDLNLRDWKHFVLADVLIIGGSFSRLPGFARPDPSPGDGLPMTIWWSRWRMRRWIDWSYVSRPRGVMTVPLPDGPVAAKTRLDWDRDPSDFSEILPIPSVVGNIYGIWKA